MCRIVSEENILTKKKTLTIKIDEKNFDGTYMPKVTVSCGKRL